MEVLEPNTIKYDDITSTIEEDSAVVWSASTTYTKNTKVRVGTTLYESLQDSNTGHNPPETMYGTSAWWRSLGPTNRAAMFDDHLYTQSVAPENTSLVVSMPWELGTSGFAMLNITGCATVDVSILTGDGTTVFTGSYDMIWGCDNMWDYYAYLLDMRTEIVDTASTPQVSGTATMTFVGAKVGVGHVMVGKTWTPGATLHDVTVEIKDYSVYNTDSFGNTTTIKRNFAKLFNGTLNLRPNLADSTFRRFIEARAKPCLWMGDNRTTAEGGFESLNCFGYFKSCPLTFKGPNQCQYNLQIEGLI